jgi:uncharacterized membrane protein YebE (DUF533 family)
MSMKTILGLIAVAAMGGGAYYLYKSGQLVSGPPAMGAGAPQGTIDRTFRVTRVDPTLIDAYLQNN